MGSQGIDTIHNVELLIVSITLSSRPGVAHIIHNPELFIAYRAMSS